MNALAGLESYWTHHNVVLLSHASGRDESEPQDVGRQQTGLSHLASHLKLKKSHEQLGRMRFPSGEFAMQCQKGIFTSLHNFVPSREWHRSIDSKQPGEQREYTRRTTGGLLYPKNPVACCPPVLLGDDHVTSPLNHENP